MAGGQIDDGEPTMAESYSWFEQKTFTIGAAMANSVIHGL